MSRDLNKGKYTQYVRSISNNSNTIPEGFEWFKWRKFKKGRYSKEEINAKIKDFVLEQSKDSPVHFDIICQQVAPLFNLDRASKTVQEGVKESLKSLSRQLEKIRRKNGDNNDFFVINKTNENKIIPKIPNPKSKDEGRELRYISKQELVVAMRKIIEQSYGAVIKDRLFICLLNLYGFERINEDRKKVLTEVVKRLKREGQIEEIDGKYHIVSDMDNRR